MSESQGQRLGSGESSSGSGLPAIPDVTLLWEIARGGMGVVYRGRQPFLERDVAVKLLAEHLQGEQFAARFRREARLLAGIKHPNIVACHTAGTTAKGQSYLVMEYVDGPNLANWITEHGPLGVVPALRLARQLASALAVAADLGVIHRDVKPENVLLETPTSTSLDLAFPFLPKLVDLGLARMKHEIGDLGMTMPGAVMGTLGTMAPEQFDAPDSIDFRADIYGLGCVLYHMLTGSPAFASLKLGDVVAEKRRPDGPDPCAKCPALPAPLGRLVSQMLAADRSRRPASYRELMARFDELMAAPEQGASAAPARPASAAPRGPGLLLTAEFGFLADGGLQLKEPDFDPQKAFAATGATPAPAPPASPPPRSPDAPLLRTAEFGFLADGAMQLKEPGYDPQQAFAATGASPAPARPASAPPRSPETPLLKTAGSRFLADGGKQLKEPDPATSEAFAATVQQRIPARVLRLHPAWIFAAVAGTLVLVGVPLLSRTRGGPTVPTSAPDVATGASVLPRSVTIAGIDGTVRPRTSIDVRAETSPAGARGLTWRWAVRPEESATLVTPAAPSTALRFEGLPGDEFTLQLEVRDGSGGMLQAERRVVLDHPPSDLLAGFLDRGFFDKGGDDPSRSRVEWTRRRDGAVECTTPELPALPGLRTRSVEGSLWRVAGLLAPERLNRRFAQTAVLCRLSQSRQLAVVCEREGSNGERWTVSLREVEREGARGGIAFRPLAEPKAVAAIDQGGKLEASFTITRRGDQVDIRIGFQDGEWADHREMIRGRADHTAITLFVRGGRGVFPKLDHW